MPQPHLVWGNQFHFARGNHSISWICHHSGLFAVLKKGQVSVRSEHGSMLLSAQSAIYIPPECPYIEQQLGVETKGWFISIPQSECVGLPKKPVIVQPSDLLIGLTARLVEYSSPKSMSGRKNRLASVFIDELQEAPLAKIVQIPIPHSSSLRRIAEEIIKSPSDMKSISEWSITAGMSRRSFTRAFHRETGLPFALWRRRVKIAAAIKSLERGRSVADISFNLGYQNPSSFNVSFKKHFGQSPSEFLKETLGKQKNNRAAG